MTKKYLTAGQPLRLSGLVVRIGATQTCVDLVPDWTGTVQYCGNDPAASGGCEIGTILDSEKYTYDVFLETDTGKFWYDDSKGY